MSTTYNLEAQPKVAQSIERLLDVVKKIEAFGDQMVESAKETGAEQLIKTADEAKNVMYATATTLKNMIGQEGDNLTGNGTLIGMQEGAKTISMAFNGEV